MIDYSYTELEDRVIEVFERKREKKYLTKAIEAAYFYAENDDEPDMFIHHLKVIVYETKHNILTDKMKKDFVQYSERWDKGEFKSDVLHEDISIIQNDIDFVRSMLKD